MDKEKEVVWTSDMGFMPPISKTEGRTICREECQLTEYKQEIERLRKEMADLKYRETYFERAYMAARRTLDSKGIHMDYFLSRADYEAELKEGE